MRREWCVRGRTLLAEWRVKRRAMDVYVSWPRICSAKTCWRFPFLVSGHNCINTSTANGQNAANPALRYSRWIR